MLFKKGFIYAVTISVLSTVAYSEDKNPPDHWVRCAKDDKLLEVDAKNRLAWAKKCRFIDEDDVVYLTNKHKYPSFIHENGNFNAPISVDASCQGWKKDYITCNWGCYTPEQKVMFSGVYLPIEEASKTEKFVTTLTDGFYLGVPVVAYEEIEAFISGTTKEIVLNFTTERGKKLRVTKNHPLVQGQTSNSGKVKPASEFKVGDSLVGLINEEDVSRMGLEKIRSIQEENYEGIVYNLQPRSTKEIENIVIAQGLLNGSNRFQNEWAEREYRIRLRHTSLRHIHDVNDL